MRIKVRDAHRMQGLHPHEVMAVIDTLTGPEELVIHAPAGAPTHIDVGYPIAVNKDNYLVELPSETARGAWRVWVTGETTDRDIMEAAE
jgi:hypothetical protein